MQFHSPGPQSEAQYEESRIRMTDTIRRYGVADERILAVMSRVPRHLFIPATLEPHLRDYDPYGDYPCDIGHGQTISQPFIVAYMSTLLRIKPGDRILEIGAGSGYQTAVLAELGADVYSIEIVPELARHATDTLQRLGYRQVHVKQGSGFEGWPEYAPYQGIMSACAPDQIPPILVEQLADGGRMVLPIGRYEQQIVLVEKTGDQIRVVNDIPVRFVPMVHNSFP